MKIEATRTPFFLSAPGFKIQSTIPGDHYQSMSGTSMATPSLAGMAMLALAVNPKLSNNQAHYVLDHQDRLMEVAKNPPSEHECLVAFAQEILETAGKEGRSAQQILDRYRPVQDEMPTFFDTDAERDAACQERVNRRAEMVDVLRELEQSPTFQGRKSDWSEEGRVDIQSLDTLAKSRFYADLDAKNEAYYKSVITRLGA